MFIDNNELFVKNWDKIALKADIEEKEDQIRAMIKYDDHGDEFIYIRTKNGPDYEYGWYLNRRGYPDYDKLDNYMSRWHSNLFIRKPFLLAGYPKNSDESNEIYFYTKEILFDQDKWHWFSDDRYKKYNQSKSAQSNFDFYFDIIEGIYKNHKTVYHTNHCDDVLGYLRVNQIETEENLAKVRELAHFYRIGAIDGTAGKKEISDNDSLYGDSVIWVWRNNKFLNKGEYKIRRTRETDEWGCDQFKLNLKQFDK